MSKQCENVASSFSVFKGKVGQTFVLGSEKTIRVLFKKRKCVFEPKENGTHICPLILSFFLTTEVFPFYLLAFSLCRLTFTPVEMI